MSILQLPGPYETHTYADPVQPRQRYFNAADLGLSSVTVLTPPFTVTGNVFNIECFTTLTVYLEVLNAPGRGATVTLDSYDLDNVTLLHAFALGTSTVSVGLDVGGSGATILAGRVFRTHSLTLTGGLLGGPPDPVVSLHLFARSM